MYHFTNEQGKSFLKRGAILKTRKSRLILMSIYFLILTLLVIYYFSNNFFTPEQDSVMIKLMIYVFFIFVIALFGEWFKAFEKDSPSYKKYFFKILAVIWVLLLLIFFKDMLF